MAIPSRQIGQSVESNFLWQISSQMDRLIKVTSLASSSTLLSLKIVNNLSDLNNVTTARTNLGLASFALKHSLVSGDIPNNAANTSGTAAGLSSSISESQVTNLVSDLSGKQPTLVSGTNIKTINGSSILGSGNLSLILGDNITIVTNYSALPLVSSVVGNFYWVQTSQGTKWLPGALGGTYYSNGIYYSNGTTWEFIDTPYQAVQGDVDAGIITDQFVTPFTLKNSVQWNSKQASLGFTAENVVNKDATGGYIGMTGFNYNFRNVANTFTSYLTNTNTASRTYTFPNVTTTMAGLSATQTFTGLQTFQGTVATDTAPLGCELTTTGTVDASWTGTAFSTGYTHVPGSITTITASLNAVINTYYQITTTIAGRTAGSVITDFGGISSGVFSVTNSNSQIATTTG